jgi:hypothetical protein
MDVTRRRLAISVKREIASDKVLYDALNRQYLGDQSRSTGTTYTSYNDPRQQIQFGIVSSERKDKRRKPEIDTVERNQTDDRCQGCVIEQPSSSASLAS